MKVKDKEEKLLLRQPEENTSIEEEEEEEATTSNEATIEKLAENNSSENNHSKSTVHETSIAKKSVAEVSPGRDKTNDVIFLDASKSKSDCVILDLIPYCVNNKTNCVVFGNNTLTNEPQSPSPPPPPPSSMPTSTTELKPYLDSISLSDGSSCRVCHCNGDEQLISPCDCSGSVKWVHETCLIKWMKSSFKESCELCRREIEITKRRKPLSKVFIILSLR